MAASPLMLKISSQIVIQELINAQAKTVCSDSGSFSGYTDNLSLTKRADGNLFIPALGGTVTVPIPAGATLGKFLAWETDGVVDVQLVGAGINTNSDYGIVKSEFTAVVFTNNGQADVTGHYIISGA